MHDETQNTEEQSMHVLVAGKLMEELVAASRLRGRLAYQRSGDIENA